MNTANFRYPLGCECKSQVKKLKTEVKKLKQQLELLQLDKSTYYIIVYKEYYDTTDDFTNDLKYNIKIYKKSEQTEDNIIFFKNILQDQSYISIKNTEDLLPNYLVQSSYESDNLLFYIINKTKVNIGNITFIKCKL